MFRMTMLLALLAAGFVPLLAQPPGDKSDPPKADKKVVCKLAGEWTGEFNLELTPAMLAEADQVAKQAGLSKEFIRTKLAEAQAQTRRLTAGTKLAFTADGAVSFTIGGKTIQYMRAGDTYMVGDPLNGVPVEIGVILSHTVTETKIHTRLMSEQRSLEPGSGFSISKHAIIGHFKERKDIKAGDYTFELSGDKVEAKLEASKIQNKPPSPTLVGTFTRVSKAGGAKGGGPR